MEARKLIAGAVRTPDELKLVGQAFAEAWDEIADRYDVDVEKVRLQLAHAVLAVAHEQGQTVAGMKNAALRVMRLAFLEVPGLAKAKPGN